MAVADDTGGLPNLGNTCYLNAVIQAVSANSTLRESMRAHPLVCPTLVEADLRPDTLRGLAKELGYKNISKQEDAHFRLRAMVVHEGSSPYNGHYVTYTQNGNAPDEWTKRSDEQSKYCNWAEVYFKASRDVCLFFFERVEPEVNSPRQGSETPGDLESDPNRTPPPRTSQRLANPGVSPSPKPLPFVSPFKGAKKARRQLDHGSFQSDKGSEAEEFPIGTESESEERSWWEGNGDNSDTGGHSDVTPPPSKDSHHDSDSSASPGDSPVSTLVGFDSKPVGNSSASLPTHGPVSDECRVEPADSPIENPGSGGVSTLPSIYHLAPPRTRTQIPPVAHLRSPHPQRRPNIQLPHP